MYYKYIAKTVKFKHRAAGCNLDHSCSSSIALRVTNTMQIIYKYITNILQIHCKENTIQTPLWQQMGAQLAVPPVKIMPKLSYMFAIYITECIHGIYHRMYSWYKNYKHNTIHWVCVQGTLLAILHNLLHCIYCIAQEIQSTAAPSLQYI